jgi:hypothetical protein
MKHLRISSIGKLFLLASALFILAAIATAQGTQSNSSPSPSPNARSSPPAGGAKPLSFSPDKLEFSDHEIGTASYSQVVTLKNNGSVAVRINVVISTGDVDFALAAPLPPDTLAPGADCLIYVKFAPIGAEIREGQLKVNYQPADNSAPASNQVIDLSGKGFIPKLRLSQQSLDFGSQVIGSTSLVRTLILTAGDEPVGGVVATTTGDFTVTPVVCEQLQPSASCALSVTFVPKAKGKIEGSLTVLNDKTPRKVLVLTGVGLESCNTAPAFWSREQLSSVTPVLLIVLIYLLALVLVRWNMIARPTRNLLVAEIGAVRRRAEMVGPQPALEHVLGLLDQAQELVGNANANTWLDHLFWSRGQELAAWSYVHEAEEQLVFFLPPESVRAELERVEGDLREAATPTALGLADRIKEALAAAPLLPLEDPARKALEEALQLLQPTSANLASDVSEALKRDPKLTSQEWQQLAEQVLSYLSPKAASLRDQISQVLTSPAATEQQLKDLLQQAAAQLETDAFKLAAQLQTACAAGTATPPSPLTADDWKAVIEKANEFLTPHASLAVQIKIALAAKPEVPIDRWRALHSEALGYLYNRSDTDFAALVSWQNKTVWLVGCSLLLIVALAATLQHGILFLVGATGGLMSRLMRSLSRAEVPTDYGASWSTLFLSPLVGALAGWSGILLVIVGVEFNILGSALKFDWCNTFNPVMLGLAFLMGFSERFFDGILDQLNRKAEQSTSAPTSAPPAGPITIGTAAVLPEGKLGQAYTQTLAASGGTPPYKWTLVTGALPAGLSVASAGQIAGTPTAKGTAKFTLQVSDAAAKTQTLEFTIVIT